MYQGAMVSLFEEEEDFVVMLQHKKYGIHEIKCETYCITIYNTL